MKSYYIETYGCQMNVSDSEALAGLLESTGLLPARAPEDADVIILNTCTVRQTAAERVFGRAGQLGCLKARRPDLILGVSGCLPQHRGMVKRLLMRAPKVDLIFSPEHAARLPELLKQARDGPRPVVLTGFSDDGYAENLPRVRSGGVRAWVTIVRGCSNFCSYCVVPYVRGPETSRRPGAVVSEVEELAARGYLEVTLLGQNVNVYGHDLDEETGFVSLLARLDRIEGLERIRYTTSHPRDFHLQMVDDISEIGKVCEHFHLPVQSGSDRVLTKMNRGYTRDQYLALTRHIRRRIPSATITTDIIVGFPGEDEGDFQQTVDLCRRVEFDGAFTFMYSPREGTSAFDLQSTVDREQARGRLSRLMEVLHPIHLARNRALVGTEVEILVEGPSRRDDSVVEGRTRGNRIVLVPGGDPRPRLIRTIVTDAGTWALRGRMVEVTRA